MCRSPDEPGGPRRCSADARRRYEQAQQHVADLEAADQRLTGELDRIRTYRSERAFRAALNDRIREVAADLGLAHNDLARRFALQQFISRIFSADPHSWVITGGTALQFRTLEARPTADVDLAVTRDIADIADQLRTVSARRGGEHGEFQVDVRGVPTNPGFYTGRITYILNGTRFAVAKIDIAAHRELPVQPDSITPEPVLQIDDTWAMPRVSTMSVPTHLADKLAAMHERHNDLPSSRAHDLADILIISRSCTVDAAELHQAIEAQKKHRNIAIPEVLQLPSPDWRATYRNRVSQSGLPAGLRDADAALAEVNAFLGPVLSGRITAGCWDPACKSWGCAR
ncbi:nucleotidyl transferase AbiEii/AbiGii toxin family protein [Mycobacteroides abscessus]